MSERKDDTSGGPDDRSGRRSSGQGRGKQQARGQRPGAPRASGRRSDDRATGSHRPKAGESPRRQGSEGRPRRPEPGNRGRDSQDRRAPGRGSGRRNEPVERSEAQLRYDGPPIPEDITGAELHRETKAQLRSLPDKLALRVARHLVSAARLLDSDPETAYQHTLAARARAARIAMVREACGEAAYAAGRFKDALAELKAARRMNGSAAYLPMMADCERALGRPERALALAKDAAVAPLDDAGRAEMTIVEAGARRDLGDVGAALRTLEGAPLRSRSRASWVARLRYAYADGLLAAGRPADAREWFERAAGVDAEGLTDALERLAELDESGVADGERGRE